MALADDLVSIDNMTFYDQNAMPGIESVTYKPISGNNKLINIHVDRRPPEYVDGEIVASTIEVWMQNHGSKGMTTIDKNGDTISIPSRRGGSASDHVIVEIIDQDAGMWHLLLK